MIMTLPFVATTSRTTSKIPLPMMADRRAKSITRNETDLFLSQHHQPSTKTTDYYRRGASFINININITLTPLNML
jgi:hypothetical protein